MPKFSKKREKKNHQNDINDVRQVVKHLINVDTTDYSCFFTPHSEHVYIC